MCPGSGVVASVRKTQSTVTVHLEEPLSRFVEITPELRAALDAIPKVKMRVYSHPSWGITLIVKHVHLEEPCQTLK